LKLNSHSNLNLEEKKKEKRENRKEIIKRKKRELARGLIFTPVGPLWLSRGGSSEARRVHCCRRQVGPCISEPAPRARLHSRTRADLWARLARTHRARLTRPSNDRWGRCRRFGELLPAPSQQSGAVVHSTSGRSRASSAVGLRCQRLRMCSHARPLPRGAVGSATSSPSSRNNLRTKPAGFVANGYPRFMGSGAQRPRRLRRIFNSPPRGLHAPINSTRVVPSPLYGFTGEPIWRGDRTCVGRSVVGLHHLRPALGDRPVGESSAQGCSSRLSLGGIVLRISGILRRSGSSAAPPPRTVGRLATSSIAGEAPVFLFSRSSSWCSTLCFSQLMDRAPGGRSAARMPLPRGAPLLSRGCEVGEALLTVHRKPRAKI
jgi:hypothetical protein